MIGVSRGLPLKCIAGGHIEGTVLVAPAASAAAPDIRRHDSFAVYRQDRRSRPRLDP